MSVSHDCLVGDKIYVIVAKPCFDEEENYDSINSLRLKIGETVKYIDWYNDHLDSLAW